MQLKEKGRCSKCGNMVERSKAKISGKGNSYWVCKVCHTRCSQLSAIYGGWPPKHFRLLSEEKKQEFFTGIKNLRYRVELKMHADNFFRTKIQRYHGTKNKNRYLSLSEWQKRGFDVEKIIRKCKGMMVYALEMREKKQFQW